MSGGLHPPLSVIASWPKPNHLNPELRGWLVPAVNIVLFSLALTVASLRLFARFFILRSAGIDDYLIALNLVPLLGLTIALSIAVKVYHFDRHIWDVPIDEATATRKILFAIEILYVISTGLTKLSVLTFYKRLSDGGISPTLIRVSQSFIAFVGFTTAFFTILPFLACTPFNAFFDQVDPRWFYTHLKPGLWKCFDELTHFYANGSISIFQDFVAVGLPLALFHGLQIPRRQKILLGAVFFVGFCVCIIGVLRLVAISHLYTTTYDLTWETQYVWIWTGTEANVAVICACLPCCRVYASRFLNYPVRSWNSNRTPDRTPRASVKAGWSANSSSAAANSTSRKQSVVAPLTAYNGTTSTDLYRPQGDSIDQIEDVEMGSLRTLRVPSPARTIESYEMHEWDSPGSQRDRHGFDRNRRLHLGP
ncbi:hypothetical protein EJ05DRAFT_21782 [Pseudovirgaria hyperparasitica]|uniref:Rhodopsin domain-containing protein n=1 Tax=Pseudovirgaria hyperparasitica TaxID=470096 RepID=A0A6A6WLS3_9PEZI|nr:uncharacterized protein EJ05DRAFT_21782 [Pseudovirgaria hyperparasitica]KAF2762959.1 hypothetical protein EJ05DRAFT_21782 [Pseudovirgaria hyperparasitica]